MFLVIKVSAILTNMTERKNRMKKEKIEYYTVKPNLKQIYGKKVKKDTKFTEQTEDGRVHQTFENLTLTTHIKNEVENGGFIIKETSELVIKMPEDTILIWDEGEGFIVPQCQMCTLSELQEEIKDIQEIYEGGKNDTKGNESKDV